MRGDLLFLVRRQIVLVLAAVTSLSACASEPARRFPNNPDPMLHAVEAELKAFPAPGVAIALVRSDRTKYRNFGNEAQGSPPVTSRTVFQIASLTKPFTAIVLLRLAEKGQLTLDDRATKWLAWLPQSYSEVTLRHLLNHTSGVPRDLRRENVDEFSTEEFRRRFLEAKPSFAVGERWEYSNTGYILLSMIAEEAGGKKFGDLLDNFIFRPAGMRRSAYRAQLLSASGRAMGHDWQENAWKVAPPVHSGYGNSGIESTAEDLALFAVALHRRRILSAESYDAMLAPAVLSSGALVNFDFREAPTSYGLGWFLTDFCGNRVATHGGTIVGYSAGLFWALEPGISTAALANGKAGPDRIGIAEKLGAKALREILSCPPAKPAPK